MGAEQWGIFGLKRRGSFPAWMAPVAGAQGHRAGLLWVRIPQLCRIPCVIPVRAYRYWDPCHQNPSMPRALGAPRQPKSIDLTSAATFIHRCVQQTRVGGEFFGPRDVAKHPQWGCLAGAQRRITESARGY